MTHTITQEEPRGRLLCPRHDRYVVQGQTIRPCPDCGYTVPFSDLLEALKEVEDTLDGWVVDADTDDCVEADLLKIVRAAINKAEGR